MEERCRERSSTMWPGSTSGDAAHIGHNYGDDDDNSYNKYINDNNNNMNNIKCYYLLLLK